MTIPTSFALWALTTIAFNRVQRGLATLCHQPTFPDERMGYDGVEIVELGRPAQQFADAPASAAIDAGSPGRRGAMRTGSSAPTARRTASITSITE